MSKVALGNFHPLKFLESSGSFQGKFPVKFHPFWNVTWNVNFTPCRKFHVKFPVVFKSGKFTTLQKSNLCFPKLTL